MINSVLRIMFVSFAAANSWCGGCGDRSFTSVGEFGEIDEFTASSTLVRYDLDDSTCYVFLQASG